MNANGLSPQCGHAAADHEARPSGDYLPATQTCTPDLALPAKELASCSDLTRSGGCLPAIRALASPVSMEVGPAMLAEAATKNRAVVLSTLFVSRRCIQVRAKRPALTAVAGGGYPRWRTRRGHARSHRLGRPVSAGLPRLRVGRRWRSSPTSAQPHELLVGSMTLAVACRRGCLRRCPRWPACEAPAGT
jgi:hypothetical protein